MTLDDVVEECQTASLASERAIPDAGKVAVLIKTLTLEDGHHALVAHLAVADNGIEDDLTVGINVLQGIPGDVLEELRDGEESA